MEQKPVRFSTSAQRKWILDPNGIKQWNQCSSLPQNLWSTSWKANVLSVCFYGKRRKPSMLPWPKARIAVRNNSIQMHQFPITRLFLKCSSEKGSFRTTIQDLKKILSTLEMRPFWGKMLVIKSGLKPVEICEVSIKSTWKSVLALLLLQLKYQTEITKWGKNKWK